jgi:hypothetical protein
MFKSDNVGNMNVTTTLFQASHTFLTLVTRDGQPWDFVASTSESDARRNHSSMIAACALLDVMMAVREAGVELN